MTLMTHKFSFPTDTEMENLIKQVFESMAVAEESRLSAIESQLLQKAERNKQIKLNKLPWWIVLVLAGGIATATWWTENLLTDRQNVEIRDEQSVSDDKIEGRQDEPLMQENKGEISKDNDSPIIYQRESF